MHPLPRRIDPKGNLSLSTAAAVLRGGDSGPAVVPGKPEESVLLDMIEGDPPEMPRKDTPLSKQDVAAIRDWIGRGAAWPDGLELVDRRFKGQRWWAFEPLTRPPVPAVPRSIWARTPIDAFVLAKLAQQRLTPSPEADRRTLIRRLTFDLIGLPPTPEEVEAFVARSGSRSLRSAGRSAARQPPLRRALGPALARRGALRRHAWLRQGQAARPRLALSRLCDRRLQRRQALRPVHSRADRRRRACARTTARHDRDRLHRRGAVGLRRPCRAARRNRRQAKDPAPRPRRHGRRTRCRRS